MRYRAILITSVKLPRPVQHFSNDLEEARNWAREILTEHLKSNPDDGPMIRIYETAERLNCNIWPEKEE